MKYKDLSEFEAQHPELAATVIEGGDPFLDDIRKRISSGQDITRKMLRALKKWVERNEVREAAEKRGSREGD